MYLHSHLPKPLPPARFYILLALAKTELHRYALKAAVQHASLGSVIIPDSKLYALIAKMHGDALIDLIDERPTKYSSQPRAHYTISKYGVIALKAESRRLDHAAKLIQAQNLLDDQTPTDIERLLLDYAKIPE